MWSTQRRRLPPLLFLAVQIAMLLLFSSTSCMSATSGFTKIQDGLDEHKPIRLLLLGESGAGKTTFLNLLLWYAEVSRLPNPGQIGVDSIRHRHDKSNENSENKYEAQTNVVTSYKLQMGDGVWFEILDTPGFNDNRGINQDEENANLIVARLRKVEYINAILLVSSGQQSRITSSFKLVMEGLKNFLPASLSESTMCIFTWSMDEDDMTFPLHLLQDDLGLEPPTPQFVLDNPFAQIGSEFGECDEDTLKDIHHDAVELIPRLDDLFKELSTFAAIPMTVLDTMEINRSYKKKPFRIVLAGPAGSGKSTFCELLRFHLTTSHLTNPLEASAEFLRDLKLNSSSPSDTKLVQDVHTVKLDGGGIVEIIDTPGLLDGPTQGFEQVIEIGNRLKTLDYVDAILLIFNGKESRNNDDMKYMMAQFSAVFHPDLYSSIAMLFTHIDNDPDRSDSMVSKDFLTSEFGFSSKIVKDRSFYVDNPLHLLASKFDLKSTGQTIQSLLHRNNTMKLCYQRGTEEVVRLLRYFTSSVKRCENPSFGFTPLLSIRESLARIPEAQTQFVSARETQARSVLKHGDPVSKHASAVSEAHKSLQNELFTLERSLQLLAINYPKFLRVVKEYLTAKQSSPDVMASLKVVSSQLQTLQSLPPRSFPFDSNACTIYFVRSAQVFLKRVEKEFECDEADKKKTLQCLKECVCDYLKCGDDKDMSQAILDNVIRSQADDDRKSKWTNTYSRMNWITYMGGSGPSRSVLAKQQKIVDNRRSVYARALRCLRVSPNDKLEDTMMEFICNRHATLKSARAMKHWRPHEENFESKVWCDLHFDEVSLFGYCKGYLSDKARRDVVDGVCNSVEQKSFASNEVSVITSDEHREISGFMSSGVEFNLMYRVPTD